MEEQTKPDRFWEREPGQEKKGSKKHFGLGNSRKTEHEKNLVWENYKRCIYGKDDFSRA